MLILATAVIQFVEKHVTILGVNPWQLICSRDYEGPTCIASALFVFCCCQMVHAAGILQCNLASASLGFTALKDKVTERFQSVPNDEAVNLQ